MGPANTLSCNTFINKLQKVKKNNNNNKKDLKKNEDVLLIPVRKAAAMLQTSLLHHSLIAQAVGIAPQGNTEPGCQLLSDTLLLFPVSASPASFCSFPLKSLQQRLSTKSILDAFPQHLAGQCHSRQLPCMLPGGCCHCLVTSCREMHTQAMLLQGDKGYFSIPWAHTCSKQKT